MCVVSMVMDHFGDEWRRRYYPIQPVTPQPISPFVVSPFVPLPTQQELDEFRRLLERAREYDRKNNEPDCEMDDKKRKLLDMARELGVDISFIEKES